MSITVINTTVITLNKIQITGILLRAEDGLILFGIPPTTQIAFIQR